MGGVTDEALLSSQSWVHKGAGDTVYHCKVRTELKACTLRYGRVSAYMHLQAHALCAQTRDRHNACACAHVCIGEVYSVELLELQG